MTRGRKHLFSNTELEEFGKQLIKFVISKKAKSLNAFSIERNLSRAYLRSLYRKKSGFNYYYDLAYEQVKKNKKEYIQNTKRQQLDKILIKEILEEKFGTNIWKEIYSAYKKKRGKGIV